MLLPPFELTYDEEVTLNTIWAAIQKYLIQESPQLEVFNKGLKKWRGVDSVSGMENHVNENPMSTIMTVGCDGKINAHHFARYDAKRNSIIGIQGGNIMSRSYEVKLTAQFVEPVHIATSAVNKAFQTMRSGRELSWTRTTGDEALSGDASDEDSVGTSTSTKTASSTTLISNRSSRKTVGIPNFAILPPAIAGALMQEGVASPKGAVEHISAMFSELVLAHPMEEKRMKQVREYLDWIITWVGLSDHLMPVIWMEVPGEIHRQHIRAVAPPTVQVFLHQAWNTHPERKRKESPGSESEESDGKRGARKQPPRLYADVTRSPTADTGASQKVAFTASPTPTSCENPVDVDMTAEEVTAPLVSTSPDYTEFLQELDEANKGTKGGSRPKPILKQASTTRTGRHASMSTGGKVPSKRGLFDYKTSEEDSEDPTDSDASSIEEVEKPKRSRGRPSKASPTKSKSKSKKSARYPSDSETSKASRSTGYSNNRERYPYESDGSRHKHASESESSPASTPTKWKSRYDQTKQDRRTRQHQRQNQSETDDPTSGASTSQAETEADTTPSKESSTKTDSPSVRRSPRISKNRKDQQRKDCSRSMEKSHKNQQKDSSVESDTDGYSSGGTRSSFRKTKATKGSSKQRKHPPSSAQQHNPQPESKSKRWKQNIETIVLGIHSQHSKRKGKDDDSDDGEDQGCMKTFTDYNKRALRLGATTATLIKPKGFRRSVLKLLRQGIKAAQKHLGEKMDRNCQCIVGPGHFAYMCANGLLWIKPEIRGCTIFAVIPNSPRAQRLVANINEAAFKLNLNKEATDANTQPFEQKDLYASMSYDEMLMNFTTFTVLIQIMLGCTSIIYLECKKMEKHMMSNQRKYTDTNMSKDAMWFCKILHRIDYEVQECLFNLGKFGFKKRYFTELKVGLDDLRQKINNHTLHVNLPSRLTPKENKLLYKVDLEDVGPTPAPGYHTNPNHAQRHGNHNTRRGIVHQENWYAPTNNNGQRFQAPRNHEPRPYEQRNNNQNRGRNDNAVINPNPEVGWQVPRGFRIAQYLEQYEAVNPPPRLDGKMFCIMFHSTGQCGKGIACKHEHTDPRNCGKAREYGDFIGRMLAGRNNTR